MLSAILRWGAISGAVSLAIFGLSYLFIPVLDASTYALSEIIGYAGILASLCVIYLGMARYFSGALAAAGVWERIRFGLGVAFISGIIFGLFNVIYVTLINPGFTQAYYDYYLTTLTPQSGPEFDRKVAELEGQRAMFGSPLVTFIAMAATVWAVGIPVTLISAFIHKAVSRRRAT